MCFLTFFFLVKKKIINLNQMLKVMNHNQIIGLVISSQDEQTGPVADPSSTNPYRMSIEEYFNPSPEANSRGKIVKS